METILIKNGLVLKDGTFQALDLLCHHGKIALLTPNLEETLFPYAKVIDAKGCFVSPGFIDVHTHGACGVDFNSANEEDLRKVARYFASQGVTSFCASLLTDTDDTIDQCLKSIQHVASQEPEGAKLLGAHLEGPFLACAYKGAMPEHLLKKGDVSLIKKYQQKYPEMVKYITVSPEVEGVMELIEALANDVVIAIGHSGADYDTAQKALQCGARSITHTFNAMRLFHQHEPAIMGAALESDCWCEAICDGKHLHPGTVRMLIKCKGWDKVVSVTDSIMATGMPDGDYKLGVNDIVVQDGDAKLKTTGVRAGSTLTAHRALHNVLDFTRAKLEKVLPLFTQNPATMLRLENAKGTIDVGKDADIIILNQDLFLQYTIVGGKIVFQST